MTVQMRIRKRRRMISYERNSRFYNKAKKSALMLMMTLIIAGSAGIIFSNQALAAEIPVYENVYVNDGDTVWSIAEKYVTEDKDIRKYVKEICKENGIDGYMIYPGQVIKVLTN